MAFPVAVKQEDPMDVDRQDDDDDDDDIDDEDDDDPVVREIDVFLSPQLGEQLYLLQLPLQPIGSSNSNNKNNNHQEDNWTSARLKPRHHMLELQQPLPELPPRQDQLQFPLRSTERTWQSQTIPLSTHYCLAKFIDDDDDDDNTTTTTAAAPSQLHLVPLQHVFQMRPSMKHIDQLVEQQEQQDQASSSLLDESPPTADELDASGGGSVEKKPLMFKRKESERAAQARLHSYAYKKASEDAEEWLPLQLHGHGRNNKAKDNFEFMVDDDDNDPETAARTTTVEYNNVMRQVQCPEPQQYCLESSSEGGRRVDYIESLNYMAKKPGAKRSPTANSPKNTDPRALLHRLTTLLQNGWPIPFQVIKLHFLGTNNNNNNNNNATNEASISDEALLQGLNQCSILVRGNFCLKQMATWPPPLQRIRTFVLLLLQTRGFVSRPRVEAALEEGGGDHHNKWNGILTQVARRSPLGWELRVEDDVAFVAQHPETSRVHLQYWEEQAETFSTWLERYDREEES